MYPIRIKLAPIWYATGFAGQTYNTFLLRIPAAIEIKVFPEEVCALAISGIFFLISFVSMFGVGLYGLAAQGSALSAVIAAISLGGLINLILIEVKALPLKRILQQLSNISSEEVENSH